ncbi:rhamnogalacturonan acetylesterase [Paenibacillus sp. 32352]|uniref:rhamnogalacturonan acetylesterase n=1 Tax=Paenibacillus sp. 32352 TaxID=1969111 RepID=UPI0015C44F5B|nr:rhamnogalacturonan acetylesterase [Paenibacillus sp. 32352]
MTSKEQGNAVHNMGEESASRQMTVYLAGDSTVSNYTADRAPRAGWGQMIGGLLDKQVNVHNAASSGRSSKSFIDEGRLDPILEQIGKGDYLLIQFGHNDEKKEDPSRYTEPNTTYKSFLKQYIDGARNKGAEPVLITPVERNGFDANGRLKDSHRFFTEAMKSLGKELKVPVIDLTAKSKALFEKLGPEATKELFLHLEPGQSPNYPEGVQDNTHFSERGALEMAKLVVEGIVELQLPLSRHVIK